MCSPVAVDEAGVDVVRTFEARCAAQHHSAALKRKNVHQPVLELVGGQICRQKTGRRSFRSRQSLNN